LFGRFFVPFVFFVPFFALKNHFFSKFAGVSTKNGINIGKIFVIFQSNLQRLGTKNRKIAKIFISFSHIELQKSQDKNRPLFSTQTCIFTLIIEGRFFCAPGRKTGQTKLNR
jgi:hypothetical protein